MNKKTLLLTGLIATAALTFSACSSNDTAQIDTEAVAETAAPQLPETEPGLIYPDFPQGASVAETLTPEQNQVITPAGTLTIESVETLNSVVASDIGMDISGEYDIEEAPQTAVQAAHGEVFRVVKLYFEPRFSDTNTPEELPAASLSVKHSGQQTHISDFNEPEVSRILFSVPEDDAQLVITSDGHEQSIDVLTGERVIEEDDPAAGYYRDTTVQDIHHDFQIENDAIQVMSGLGNNAEAEDANVFYDLQVRSATLSGWTRETGWASPGEAWLTVDWGYDFSHDFLRSSVTPRLVQTDLTLTADLPDTTLEERHVEEDGSSEDVRTVFAVPVDTTDIDLSISGSTEFILEDMVYDIVHGQDTTLPIDTETINVEFPNTSTDL